MIEKFQRPLSESERADLAVAPERIHDVLKSGRRIINLRWLCLWLAIFILSALGGIYILTFPGGASKIWLSFVPFLAVNCIISLYAVWMLISSYLRSRSYLRWFIKVETPKIREAVANGQVCVMRVESEYVVVIEEFEDECTAYIYDLGDGQSLYLRGDEYYPDNEPGSPAGRFEIIRTVQGNRLVEIIWGPEPIKRVRTVPMAEMPKSFHFSEQPESESLLPGSPDEVLERLGHRAV